MRFVKTEDLEKGMRLAKPIYNRNGVLLYDRDTKLTKQGINSVNNFNLIGIYILEPTEPLPPMSEEDIEFERFQTMGVFGLREDIDQLLYNRKPENLENLVNLIQRNYARRDKKVNTLQNLRSGEDYSYKHSLYIAILASVMARRMKFTDIEIHDVIMAGLIHDIGMVNVIKNDYISDDIKLILDYHNKLETNKTIAKPDEKKLLLAKVLWTADVYDDMTSMHIDKEPKSEIVAIRYLLNNVDKHEDVVVGALIDSMKLLYPGICVELTNKSSGVIIVGNEENVLRPIVLGFNYNEIYNFQFDDVYEKIQIKDIMKTLDKRVQIDNATISEYMKNSKVIRYKKD